MNKERKMDQPLKEHVHLAYLKDTPIHNDKAQKSKEQKDQFKHHGYVEALYNMVSNCPDPFCIGLFGGWGSGKTGIVKGLSKVIAEKGVSSNLKFLYFNVWKYSSDSLRRQLLLKIDKDWFNNSLNFEKKLYLDVKHTTEVNSEFSWDILTKPDRLWFLGITWVIILLVAIFQYPIGFCQKDWISVIGTALFPVLAVVISAMQGKETIIKTFEDENKPTSVEEFEKHFQNALEQVGIEGTRKIFVLDDLDRCDSEKVLEVLAAISTFLDEPGCVYVIPCDDKRIKEHIKSGLYGKNSQNKPSLEEDDFLKKLFNAHITLRLTVDEHIEEYISDLTKQIGISNSQDKEQLQTILQVGLSKNPRRIKQFLNILVAGYNLALELELEGSLTTGVISENIGFLAKVLFIRDFFPSAFEYFESNPGSFREVESGISENQRSSKSLTKEQGEITDLSTEHISVRRFIDATSGITNDFPDIFFRFSGKKDLVEVETISGIIQAGEGKNLPEFKRLLNEILDKDEIMRKLSRDIGTRIKATRKSSFLRTNLVGTMINSNIEINSKELKKLTGEIIKQAPDNILIDIKRGITPIVWDIASEGYIQPDKTQILGSAVFRSMNESLKESNVSSSIIWKLDADHIKKINENWKLFKPPLQISFSEHLLQLIDAELRSNDSTTDFWNWILPANAKFPVIIQRPDLLKNVASKISGEKLTKNMFNAGLLVCQLHKFVDSAIISELIAQNLDHFDSDYDKNNPNEFAPNVIQKWLLASNQKFTMDLAMMLFQKLQEKKDDWDAQGYNTNLNWVRGLIELYKKLGDDQKNQIREIISKEIENDLELYYELYDETKFGHFALLNFKAFEACFQIEHVNDDSDRESWLNRIRGIVDEVFKYNSKKLLDHFLQPLWNSTDDDSHKITLLLLEILAIDVKKIDAPELIAKKSLLMLLEQSFWVNQSDSHRKQFITSSLKVLDDSSIKQTVKDDLIRIWMTKLLDIGEHDLKTTLSNLRHELFRRLSTKERKESLNQIWTRIKSSLEEGLELQFIIDNLVDLKSVDKRELFEELFEQLNTVEDLKMNLFVTYALNESFVNLDIDMWVENIIPFIRQNPDLGQTQNIKKFINKNHEKLQSAKSFSDLNSILNPSDSNPR